VEIAGLPAIIAQSRFRTVSAYNRFFQSILSDVSECDEWQTRSGNPCLFCRAMEALSQEI
jgi:hypothetical protein